MKPVPRKKMAPSPMASGLFVLVMMRGSSWIAMTPLYLTAMASFGLAST
jgi:hypothetical protein